MRRISMMVSAVALVAGAAFAHTGVKNAAVMARMDGMSQMGEAVKTLGQMAKGEIAFDAMAAKQAAAAIAKHAAETPALFEAPEDDPKSEAKAEIWENFADFTDKSVALEKLALELSEELADRSDLPAAMASLGDACSACHKAYRE